MAERNVYIDNIPVETARAQYLAAITHRLGSEVIAVSQARGRITASTVHAVASSPNSNQAAMDGIAVHASQTVTARETAPLDLIGGRDFAWINTGQTLPDGFDAVIMIEDVVSNAPDRARIYGPAAAWQHVRAIGEDIVATEMIVPSGHRLRPIDLAALLAGGVESVAVIKQARVALLPTGQEIVQHRDAVKVGTIRDTNSVMLAGLLEATGVQTLIAPVVADDPERLRDAIQSLLEDADMLLVIAGSSAGSKDYTAAVLRAIGTVVVHGVAMKPGKPVVLATVRNKPVIGIPGFPVSAYLACQTFVLPAVAALTGEKTAAPAYETAYAARKIVSSVKSEEYVRVNLGVVNDRLVASPLSSGAGVLMSLVRADGIAVIPRQSEGIDAGNALQVMPLQPMSVLREKLFAVGSHDLVVDILADLMPLSSSHVGSQAGFVALKSGGANLAPTHILDPATGVYNEAAVRAYFPYDDMALIKGVERIQGIMVKRGNPKNIRAVRDLARDDIVFVNRQRGAGTRILLDFLLQVNGIDSGDLTGYDRALPTHMAVASAVASGSADAGLGVQSAANALGLDFIPIGSEDYDFLVYASSLGTPRLQTFLHWLKSDIFRTRVDALGGYGFARTGAIIRIDATSPRDENG